MQPLNFQLFLKRTNTDFLDILLEARDEDGQGLTDSEIRNEVDTFLLAGSFTKYFYKYYDCINICDMVDK